MTTATAPAIPVYRTGDRVTYLGKAAEIVHGNEADEWGPVTRTVNIILTLPVAGVFRQMDVLAASLLRTQEG